MFERPPSSLADAPIGLFDSGVGGLTVLDRVRERLENERLVYIADQIHVPYGARPLEQIHGFATGLSAELFRRGCKAVVMACNISSATALDEVARAFPDRIVLGMIVPGAAAAAARTKTGQIGVLATAGTVASNAYPNVFARMDSTLKITQVACPEFVPLVERGEGTSPAAFEAAERYVAPLLRAGVDTVVLGCTHYPYLMTALGRAARGRIDFVDPAVHTARELADRLGRRGNTSIRRAESHTLLTTGPLDTFVSQLGHRMDDLDYVAAQLELRPASLHGLIPTSELFESQPNP